MINKGIRYLPTVTLGSRTLWSWGARGDVFSYCMRSKRTPCTGERRISSTPPHLRFKFPKKVTPFKAQKNYWENFGVPANCFGAIVTWWNPQLKMICFFLFVGGLDKSVNSSF